MSGEDGDLSSLISTLATLAVTPGPGAATVAAEIERVAADLDDARISDADAQIDAALTGSADSLVPTQCHVVFAFAQGASRCTDGDGDGDGDGDASMMPEIRTAASSEMASPVAQAAAARTALETLAAFAGRPKCATAMLVCGMPETCAALASLAAAVWDTASRGQDAPAVIASRGTLALVDAAASGCRLLSLMLPTAAGAAADTGCARSRAEVGVAARLAARAALSCAVSLGGGGGGGSNNNSTHGHRHRGAHHHSSLPPPPPALALPTAPVQWMRLARTSCLAACALACADRGAAEEAHSLFQSAPGAIDALTSLAWENDAGAQEGGDVYACLDLEPAVHALLASVGDLEDTFGDGLHWGYVQRLLRTAAATAAAAAPDSGDGRAAPKSSWAMFAGNEPSDDDGGDDNGSALPTPREKAAARWALAGLGVLAVCVSCMKTEGQRGTFPACSACGERCCGTQGCIDAHLRGRHGAS